MESSAWLELAARQRGPYDFCATAKARAASTGDARANCGDDGSRGRTLERQGLESRRLGGTGKRRGDGRSRHHYARARLIRGNVAAGAWMVGSRFAKLFCLVFQFHRGVGAMAGQAS